ncbi:DUF6985 domain-containing protein [Bacillus nitratireducens]|uniref:DUF6985 domain-containing protein n=1 Tax=Bacillus nitratireducens TaxID=2026193 RepID=UPI000BF6BAAC|nr:DUF2004 domain-containing protein [Bacillus nitratireducens]PFH68228.1 DUF2004 domain-containing protein [Bacillus cereus]
MILNDSVFGKLEYGYGWVKDTIIHFWGKETKITLMIDGEEDDNFDEEQYVAYTSLMQNWEHLQQSFLQPILEYYKQKRHELGYDIEVNESYPLVETTDQILEMIDLDGIVVPYGDLCEGRGIRFTFNCTWDTENGLGIRMLNEIVTEVGYQDIAI